MRRRTLQTTRRTAYWLRCSFSACTSTTRTTSSFSIQGNWRRGRPGASSRDSLDDLVSAGGKSPSHSPTGSEAIFGDDGRVTASQHRKRLAQKGSLRGRFVSQAL